MIDVFPKDLECPLCATPLKQDKKYFYYMCPTALIKETGISHYRCCKTAYSAFFEFFIESYYFVYDVLNSSIEISLFDGIYYKDVCVLDMKNKSQEEIIEKCKKYIILL